MFQKWRILGLALAMLLADHVTAGDEDNVKKITAILGQCILECAEKEKRQIADMEIREQVLSIRTDYKKMKWLVPLGKDTKSHQELCALSVEYVPALIQVLAASRAVTESYEAYYLDSALFAITRAVPRYPSDLPQDDLRAVCWGPNRWLRWWQTRDKVPERFEAAYQKFLKAEKADKGVVSTSRTVFDSASGESKAVCEPSEFGKALAELRAFGLDAIPQCAERFEAKDYRLRFLFEELTGERRGVSEIVTAESVCQQHIKWWKNPDENAPAVRFQMPNLEAGVKKK